MKNSLIMIVAVLTFSVVQGQEKNKESTFEVDGVCEMCKKRIESAALRTKGVKLAEWNKTTKELKVIYNEQKSSLEEIKRAVAEKGHDAENMPADSSAYEKLPECCRYKDGVKTH